MFNKYTSGFYACFTFFLFYILQFLYGRFSKRIGMVGLGNDRTGC